MSEGGTTRKAKGPDREGHEEADSTSEAGQREVIDDIDELLDEIDEVLEENAEEFVRGYVQKGGQ